MFQGHYRLVAGVYKVCQRGVVGVIQGCDLAGI